MATDLSTRIEAIADGPASAQGDGHSVVEQDLEKVIAAQRFLNQTDAAPQKHRGLRFTRLSPPDAT